MIEPAAGAAHEAAPDDLEALRRSYWQRTRILTAALLAIWFGISFAPAYYADALNTIDFLGFPLGFYLAAQGNLLGYLLIVGFYARTMDRLDRKQAHLEGRDSEPGPDSARD